MNDRPLIRCREVVQVYAGRTARVVALAGLDLDVATGEFTTITGASGSGKSTLLRLLAGLESPTAGTIVVDGHPLSGLDSAGRERYRRELVGVVQQQTASNLLPYLDARRNVEFPLSLSGVPARRRRVTAASLLELVGVADCADGRPAELSGGQQQRVAIAVALANQPALLLADEPTGELDAESTTSVVDAFERAVDELGTTVVAVTHDPLVAARTRRTVTIAAGRVVEEIHRTPGRPGEERRFASVDARGTIRLEPGRLEHLGDGGLVAHGSVPLGLSNAPSLGPPAAPADRAPALPAPADPAPVDPASADRAPVDPEPARPAPVDPWAPGPDD